MVSNSQVLLYSLGLSPEKDHLNTPVMNSGMTRLPYEFSSQRDHTEQNLLLCPITCVFNWSATMGGQAYLIGAAICQAITLKTSGYNVCLLLFTGWTSLLQLGIWNGLKYSSSSAFPSLQYHGFLCLLSTPGHDHLTVCCVYAKWLSWDLLFVFLQTRGLVWWQLLSLAINRSWLAC